MSVNVKYLKITLPTMLAQNFIPLNRCMCVFIILISVQIYFHLCIYFNYQIYVYTHIYIMLIIWSIINIIEKVYLQYKCMFVCVCGCIYQCMYANICGICQAYQLISYNCISISGQVNMSHLCACGGSGGGIFVLICKQLAANDIYYNHTSPVIFIAVSSIAIATNQHQIENFVYRFTGIFRTFPCLLENFTKDGKNGIRLVRTRRRKRRRRRL